MLQENSALVKAFLSVVLFPTFFQEAFIRFAWGAHDPFWSMAGKRLLLLLPVLAFILACWITVASLLTVLVRPNRRAFINDLFVTWWDLGKSVSAFWGGLLKFILSLIVTSANTIKVVFAIIWSLLQELLFIPFRIMKRAGRNIVQSHIPWIAVCLTIFWCLIEATIFTYVTSSLVVDTFSNITGDTLSESFIRIPLFIFLLFVVLGSYAVLSTFVDSFQKKSISAIAGIGVIELVVLFVEVVFLYREFVDSLVPWFAQYSENFELGIFWTLAISAFVWFGIRSLSWFLFAAHGTPTILAIIQGKGLQFSEPMQSETTTGSAISASFLDKIKADFAWYRKTGDELVLTFMLPPLQILAACINFFTLLISSEHLFELPLKNLDILRNLKTTPEEVTETAVDFKSPTFNNTKNTLGELPHVNVQ